MRHSSLCQSPFVPNSKGGPYKANVLWWLEMCALKTSANPGSVPYYVTLGEFYDLFVL